MEKFHVNDICRVVYIAARNPAHTDITDKIYVCRSCGKDVWQVKKHTGTGKLPTDMLKLQCRECGLYFIANRKDLEKVLGSIDD
jgi:DNA-directed RNA polymerase subunit RPC12/RpoP